MLMTIIDYYIPTLADKKKGLSEMPPINEVECSLTTITFVVIL